MAEGEGAQSGAEGTQSGTGESTTGTTGSTTSTETSTDAGTQSGTNPETAQAVAEANALRERMKAADQRAAKFEAELKQLRDKDLPEAEKQTRELTEAQEKVSALTETNKALALQVAFLKDNTFTWHNPERAMKLVDLSKVEVNEDGTVSGLKDALSALAKSDDYLVKTDKTVEDVTPPGTVAGNNGTNGGGKPRTGALAGRLPVMNTRRKAQ